MIHYDTYGPLYKQLQRTQRGVVYRQMGFSNASFIMNYKPITDIQFEILQEFFKENSQSKVNYVPFDEKIKDDFNRRLFVFSKSFEFSQLDESHKKKIINEINKKNGKNN